MAVNSALTRPTASENFSASSTNFQSRKLVLLKRSLKLSFYQYLCFTVSRFQ
jgi:hypothetical protein